MGKGLLRGEGKAAGVQTVLCSEGRDLGRCWVPALMWELFLNMESPCGPCSLVLSWEVSVRAPWGLPGAALIPDCQRCASGMMLLSWGYSLGSPPFSHAHGAQPHWGFFPRLLLRWPMTKDQGLFSGFPNLGASEVAAASTPRPALLPPPPPALHLHQLPGSRSTALAGNKKRRGDVFHALMKCICGR